MKNFKIPISIYIILNMSISNFYAQVPDIIWEHGFGGNYDDRAMDVIEAPDGGILTVGYSNSIDGDVLINKGQRDFLVIKTNANGDMEWSKTYGGSANDYCYSVCLTNDNGFILAGETWSNDFDVTGFKGGSDYWIVKIDSAGNIIWQKTFGGSQFEVAQCVIKTISGDYLIAGISSSLDGDVTGHHGGIDNVDYWILKINDAGELIWQNSYGSSDTDDAKSIIETNDGNIIVSGYSRGYNGDVSSNYGNADYWIIKLTSDGELIWENSFGGSDTDISNSIMERFDGSLICFGLAMSNNGLVSEPLGESDFWVLKLDANGNLIWEKSYGGTDSDEGYSMIEINSNAYILTGLSQSVNIDVSENLGGSDFWLVKIDSMGNLIWENTIGGSSEDISYCLTLTNDDNFIAAGISYSTDVDVSESYTGYNYWVAKLGFCNTKYFADVDGDGYGDVNSDSISCSLPIGFVADSTDCNDLNDVIHPFLTDICNSIDDNCNGSIDEDAIFQTYFLDFDDDGFGTLSQDTVSCNFIVGYVLNSLDCNDFDLLTNPLSLEICNSIDDNCNIEIDEGLLVFTLYIDADGDTYGNPDVEIITCEEAIIGYVTNNSDCNDTLNTIYPGALELCNNLDDDCDGIIDDNVTFIQSYVDADFDNFGNNNIDTISCEIPTGYVLNNTDCDDSNPDIYPGAIEILNELDDDCDQIADEGLTIENLNNIICSISPNPSFDIINIVSNINGNGLYEIISATGQVVLYGDWDATNISISIIDIPSGIYNIRLSIYETLLSLTFIKIN